MLSIKNFVWMDRFKFVMAFLLYAILLAGCNKNDSVAITPDPKPGTKPIPEDTTERKFIWSVGIYRGSSPFQLDDFSDALNPVISAENVIDIDAKFVADPFVIHDDSSFYMFFEVLNKNSFKGEIGFAKSSDGLQWDYQQIVLSEPFHLSYPYVFKSNNEFYMVPESHIDSSVRLYKASNFPYQWEYVGNLVEGADFVDPCVVFYNKMWWLFVSKASSTVLHLYYSDKLDGEWKEHPQSPIVTNSYHFARPGGRMFLYDRNLYRYSQDDAPFYGVQVWAFKITELTTTEYGEKMVSDQPIIKAGNAPWNIYGMHQVDIFMQKEGFWYAVVDGYY